MRYRIVRSRYWGGNFEIWDNENQDRVVCIVALEKDADNIAGLLNAMEIEKHIDEDKYKECIP